VSCKIVIIGGGSYLWTPVLAGDLFSQEGLKGSTLSLVDIDKDALATMEKYCKRMVSDMGCGWTVKGEELEDALQGADYVCVSLSVGGLEAFHKDYTIPEDFGIYHSTGDTVGPSGISRVLRNIPVFVDFAKAMERYCPDAWMIHVTNPLSQITRGVNKTTSIKCVGLCHNFAGTLAQLAPMVGGEYEDMDAISVGVNHGTWMKDITCKGRNVMDEFTLERYMAHVDATTEEIETNTTDDDVEAMANKPSKYKFAFNFELMKVYGAFPVGSPAHVAENLPFYLNDEAVMKAHLINRKGVLPKRQRAKDERKQLILDRMSGKEEFPEHKASRESLSAIINSLHTGTPSRAMVAMANEGQVSDLPLGAIVETWADVSCGAIRPTMSGPMPAGTLGFTQAIIDEQEISVEAALTGSRELAIKAMTVSPMVGDKDIATALTDKLLAAQKAWLPLFNL
jgi:alpha-galactosidase/6-phospho-beta-glucosidase family protein